MVKGATSGKNRVSILVLSRNFYPKTVFTFKQIAIALPKRQKTS